MMDEDILANLGNAVRYHRKLLDISQEKLAELSDLDRTYISSLERGHRNVSVLNIVKISNALEVSPARLLREILSDDK